MADAGNNNSSGSKWSDEEKYKMMCQVIEQLTAGGARVGLAALNMPGRTVKSMTHMLGKIKEDGASFSAGGADGAAAGAGAAAAATTKKPRGKAADVPSAGRKRARKAPADPEAEFEDDGEDGGPPMMKKRARRSGAAAGGGAKKKITSMKTEHGSAAEADEDEETKPSVVKGKAGAKPGALNSGPAAEPPAAPQSMEAMGDFNEHIIAALQAAQAEQY